MYCVAQNISYENKDSLDRFDSIYWSRFYYASINVQLQGILTGLTVGEVHTLEPFITPPSN